MDFFVDLYFGSQGRYVTDGQGGACPGAEIIRLDVEPFEFTQFIGNWNKHPQSLTLVRHVLLFFAFEWAAYYEKSKISSYILTSASQFEDNSRKTGIDFYIVSTQLLASLS